MRRLLFAGLLFAGLAACKPAPQKGAIPTERLLVTKVALAPALAEARATSVADRTARWGEAYLSRGRQPDFAWMGEFDGHFAKRTGLVEVARTVDDASRFAFLDDFLEADLPTTSWLCERMTMAPAHRASCAASLLRTVPEGGALVAHVPGWRSDCPIAALKGGVVSSAALPAISDLRVAALDKRPVILVHSHWIKSREHTGSDLVVLLVDPPLARAGELRLTETDPGGPGQVTYVQAKVTVEESALRLQGRRSVRDRVSNKELSGADVDERWGLGADGKLVRR